MRSTERNNIGLIGYGLIGKAIKPMLEAQGYQVTAYDVRPADGAVLVTGPYDTIIPNHDAIVTATPYQFNVNIARICADNHVAYFDLTEDVDVTKQIHDIAMTSFLSAATLQPSQTWMMPQCGLAPGVVSIIANHLVSQFDIDGGGEVHNVEVRVGALPTVANNRMKYYLTWSSEGLVNEYINPCRAVVNGQQVDLTPLEGYETLTIDGQTYEAFNTSGGVGNLVNSMNAKNINYKTIRYPGHRDYMKFLMDDLHLNERKNLLVDIFNTAVPHITNDVVVIVVQVTGTHVGSNTPTKHEYVAKIYPQDGMSAIQVTTAAGLCIAVDWWASQPSVDKTFFGSEDIPWDFFTQSPFSKPYLDGQLGN